MKSIIKKYMLSAILLGIGIALFPMYAYAGTYDLTEIDDNIFITLNSKGQQIVKLDGKEYVDDDPVIITGEGKKKSGRIKLYTNVKGKYLKVTFKDVDFAGLTSDYLIDIASDANIYLDGTCKIQKDDKMSPLLLVSTCTAVIQPAESAGKAELELSGDDSVGVIEIYGTLEIKGSVQLTIKGDVKGNSLTTTELSQDGFVKYLDKDTGEVLSTNWGTVDEHAWDEGTITVQPSCTTKGTKTYTCTVVPTHTKTEELQKLRHNYTEMIDDKYLAKPASCTSPAEYYKSCSVCGEKGAETFISGDPLGHSYASVDSSVCSVCGYNRQHVHELSLIEAVKATDTKNGNVAYYVCQTCGQIYRDADGLQKIEDENSVIIPATGQNGSISGTAAPEDGSIKDDSSTSDAGDDMRNDSSKTENDHQGQESNQHICSDSEYEWEICRSATETTDGEMRYQCKVCGNIKYTVPISAYYQFNANTVDKIKNAGRGATLVVDTPVFISFHEMVKDELTARPDVNLVVNYQYQGKGYQMLIPAGSAEQLTELFGTSKFCGFRNMSGTFATKVR